MGEGLERMLREVKASSRSWRAEDEDEIGESSALSAGESDDDEESSPCSSSDEQAEEDDKKQSPLDGPLHELSSLVSQLPVQRGLSKFYQGKSQSFSSFSDVRSVEDLAKKNTSIKRKMKHSRSYADGLDDGENLKCSSSGGPAPAPGPFVVNSNRAMMAKKGPRGSCGSALARTSSGTSYFASGKPPPIRLHKNL